MGRKWNVKIAVNYKNKKSPFRFWEHSAWSKKDSSTKNETVACVNFFSDARNDFWSSWSSFSPCDETTCKKARQRFCTHRDTVHCPGANYYGIENEEIQCTDEECYGSLTILIFVNIFQIFIKDFTNTGQDVQKFFNWCYDSKNIS